MLIHLFFICSFLEVCIIVTKVSLSFLCSLADVAYFSVIKKEFTTTDWWLVMFQWFSAWNKWMGNKIKVAEQSRCDLCCDVTMETGPKPQALCLVSAHASFFFLVYYHNFSLINHRASLKGQWCDRVKEKSGLSATVLFWAAFNRFEIFIIAKKAIKSYQRKYFMSLECVDKRTWCI